MSRNARLYLALSLVFILSLGVLTATNAPTSALSAPAAVVPAATELAVPSVVPTTSAPVKPLGSISTAQEAMATAAAGTPGKPLKGPKPQAGTPDHATLVAVPSSPPGIPNDGTTVKITFSVFDSSNARLNGVPVTFTINSPSPLSSFPGVTVTPLGGATRNGNTVSGNTANDGTNDGVLSIQVSSTEPIATLSSIFVSASVNQNPAINGSVNITITQAPAKTGKLTSNKTTAIGDGSDTATITAVFKDNAGNGVPNKNVTVNIDQPVLINGSSSTTTSYTTTTDATGSVIFTAAFVNTGTSPVSANFTPMDTDDNIPTTPASVGVSYTPPPPDAGQSSLQVSVPLGASYNVNTIPADGLPADKAIVTVKLKDRNGHLLSGRSVTLNATGISATIAINPITTVNGSATFNVSALYPNIGTATFTVSVAGTSFINGSSPSGQATFVVPPADPGKSTITPPTSTIPADNSTIQIITVTVVDANGDALNNQNVTLSADKPAGISGLGTVNTGSGNTATFNVKSSVRTTAPDVVTFTATVNQSSGNVVLGSTAQITFTASIPDSNHSFVASIPFSGTIVGDDLTTIDLRVTLKDLGDQPIANTAVGITSSIVGPTGSTVSPVAPSNPANGKTNAQGVVDFFFKGNAANGQFVANFKVTDTDDSVVVTPNPLPITFTVPNASGTNSTIVTLVAGNQKTSVQANGIDSTTVVVTVKDAGGDTIPGKSVVLNASATGGDTLTGILVNGQALSGGTSVAVISDSNGQSSFTVTSNSPHTAGITFTATVDGQTVTVGPANPPTNPQTNIPVVIYFTNAAPNAGNSTVSVSPASEPADGSSAFTVTVKLEDQSQNLLGGRVIRLRTANPFGTGTPAAGVKFTPNAGDPTVGIASTDNTTGVATFSVTSTVAYPSGVQYYIDDLTDNAIGFTPSNYNTNDKLVFTASTTNVVDQSKSSIQVFPNTANASQLALITVTLRDSSNAPVVGVNANSVSIFQTPLPGTALPASVTVQFVSATSDSAGQLTYNISSSAATSALTLIAFTNSVDITNVPNGASNIITFTGSTATPTTTSTPPPSNTPPPTITPGGPTSTFTLTPLPSSTALPSNTAGPSVTPGAATSTMTATLADNLTSPVTSTINVFPTNVPANGQSISTILVVVRNSSSTALPNKTVTLNPSSLPAGVVLSANSGTTGSDGSVAFTITSSVATTISFTATADNVTIGLTPPGGSTSVTFTTPPNPNTVSASNSSISPSSGTVQANNSDEITVTVSVRTVNNAVPNVTTTVTLFGSNTITASPSNTVTIDSSGNAVFQLRSSTVQSSFITASATNIYGTVTINGGTTANFISSSNATSTAATSSSSASASASTLTTDFIQIPADGTTIATLTATLKSSGGTAISGKTIQINPSQVLSGVTLTTLNATTDANGQAKFTVKSTVQGSLTFSAVDTSDSPQVFITQTVTITFAASGTAAVAAPATGTATGAGLSTVPTGPVIGVVRAYRLNVRSFPGFGDNILGLLAYKTRVLVLARNPRGNWLNIQLRGGTAWVWRGLILLQRGDFARLTIIGDTTTDNGGIPAPPVLIPVAGPGTGVVTVGPIHTRSGPGLNYSQLGDLAFGTQVTILGRSSDRLWYEIQVQGGSPVWVYAYFVSIRQLNGESLPVIAAPPVK